MAKKIDIGGELHSVATDHKVTDASEIKDISKGNKSQAAFNNDVDRHEAEIHGPGGIDSRLTDVEQIEQIVLDGGEAQIAQGSDFTNPDATKRAKIPTVGAIVDGLNDGIYDVSKRNPTGGPNSDGKFTLDYILANADNLIPTSWRYGGMTISFVRTSDNKYAQYRLMTTSFSTDEDDWQGVDDEPTVESKNLVKSGGVHSRIESVANKFDINASLQDGFYTVDNNTLVYHSNSGWKTTILYVRGGDKLHLINTGTAIAPNYIVCDKELNVLSSNYGSNLNVVVTIPSNGYCVVVNNSTSYTPNPKVEFVTRFDEAIKYNTDFVNNTISPEKISLTVHLGGYWYYNGTSLVLNETPGQNYYSEELTITKTGIYTITCANQNSRNTVVKELDNNYKVLRVITTATTQHITVLLSAGEKLYISSALDDICLYYVGSLTDYMDVVNKTCLDVTNNIIKNKFTIDKYSNNDCSQGFYNLSGSIVSGPIANQDYKCIKIYCPFDGTVVFSTQGYVSSGARVYAITDEYGVIQSVANNEKITYTNYQLSVLKGQYLYFDIIANRDLSCEITWNDEFARVAEDIIPIIQESVLKSNINSLSVGVNGNYICGNNNSWVYDVRYSRYNPVCLQKGDTIDYSISLTNNYIGFLAIVDEYNNIKEVVLSGDGEHTSYEGIYTVTKSGWYVFAIYSGSFTVNYANYEKADPLPTIITPEPYVDVPSVNDRCEFGIFERIGVIGDSLSSGDLTYGGATGEELVLYKELYFYSWPQYMKRVLGNTVFNFSTGGLSAKTFFTSQNQHVRAFDTEDCQCYFIALCHNDYNWCKANWQSEGYASLEACIADYIGSESDIDLSDYTNNADTFYGNYGKIIQMIKEKVPDAKIFPITAKLTQYNDFNAAIKRMAHIFTNIYITDVQKWFPNILSWHYTEGHGNAQGYMAYSLEVSAVGSYVIRNHRDLFKYTALIGTDAASYIPTSQDTSVPSD